MDKKDIQKIFIAVPMQENMMFSWMNDKDSTAYVEQMIIEIKGNIQVKLLEESFQLLFNHYDTLRSNFVAEKVSKTRQVVLKNKKPEIEYYDFTTKENSADLIKELIESDRAKGFDLVKSCLMRMHVIKTAEDKFTIIWTNHHIILDGWSRSILVRDFYSIYNCLSAGKSYVFRTVDNFTDYAKWINKRSMEEGVSFWKDYLSGYDQNVTLKTISKGKTELYDCREEKICLDQDDYEQLKEIAKQNNVTVNILFQCIWGVLLQRYNDINDVVFGMVVSGRNSEFENINSTVGVLINSIPIRIKSKEKEAFSDLVVRTQQEINQVMQYSYIPLTEIQGSIKEVQGLVNHLTAFENYPAIENSDSESGFEIVKIYENEQINYDFGITFIPGDTMEIKIRYNNNAFEDGYINKITSHLRNMIQYIMDHPNTLIQDIHYMSSEEEKKLIELGKGKESVDTSDLTLYQLYKTSVEENTDKTSLSYTYYFKNLVDDLLEGRLSKFDEERLKEACFKKSDYIYQYNNADLITDKIPNKDKENIVLLRSRTHEIVALSKVTFDLLNNIDSEYAIGNIFNAVKENKLVLEAWKIDSSSLSDMGLEEVICHGDFESFLQFIYLLLKTGILEFTSFNLNSKKFVLDRNKTASIPVVINQDKAMEVMNYKPDCRVLLIGDTPGSATTGILYIASYLRRNGIEAYCNWNDSDRCNENLKQNIHKLLDEVKPTVVGISMKWFIHIYRVLEMAKIIKEYSDSIKVVLGGNTASYYSDDVIKEKNIDYIIKGDGELPFLKICEEAEYLPNCTYIKDGELIRNEITYVQNENNSSDIYLSDLDKIFVYKDDVYKAPYFFIFTGKGCSMNCCYCAGCRESQEKTFNRKLPFMRGYEEVRKDIQAMKDYTGVFMYDFDLPNYNSLDYYKRLWDGIDMSQHFCMFYFWKLPTEEFLELVSERYKYVYINLDLASLSERHRMQLTKLHIVKPQPTDEEIIRCFEACSRYDNIEITINQIAGLPHFDERDVDSSERMVQLLSKEFKCFRGIDWGRLHAQPGANLAKNAEKYDMHSSASTYEDFLKYSKMNVTETDIYPDLSNTFYPFIEYDDNSRNKMISQHYIRVNEILEKYITRDNRISMVYNLTYAELDQRANAVAGYLADNGIGRGDTVALLIERSMEQVVCMLGVMKAGAAYVPIDVSYPVKRKQYILADSEAKAVLYMNDQPFDLAYEGKAISLNGIRWDYESNRELDTPNAEDIAYIIYTSGTTGNPKGVMIKQNTIAKAIRWRAQEYSLSSKDVVLQLFSYAFDGFLTSMFTPLISGANALIIHNDDVNDPIALRDYIRNFGVTHFISVPQLFYAIADAMDTDDAKTLRVVTLAGDKVSTEIIRAAKKVNENLELVNEYGPTECSVVATIAHNIQDADKVTIGKPVDDTEVYILDKNLNLLPQDCIGEICLGGTRLAVGYVNNDELTREKFVPNPFTQNGRLYHTGDVGRWTADGNIEFMERNDSQVKIRGYRIETGEIEQCLVEIDGVSQAVVKCFDDKNGNKYLCAYVVPAMGIVLKNEEIESILSVKLASYMMPQKIVQINQLPVTANGKIDYSMLPDPLLTKDGSTKPVTELEKAVAAIWEEVLGIQDVGVTDSFLTLGGDSIKVMQIISRLQRINIKVKMKDIFKYPTIRSLLSYVEKQKQGDKVEHAKEENLGEFGLTPIQSWFFERDFKNKNYWNQSIMIYKKDGFDEQICNKCLNNIIAGNTALRTKFMYEKKQYSQKVLGIDTVSTRVQVYDMRQCDDVASQIEKEAENLQRSLDISEGIVIKAGLFKTNEGDHLLFTVHHLVVDGVSLRILLERFYSSYKMYLEDGNSTENDVRESLSYKEWYMALRSKTADWAPKNLAYWERTVQSDEEIFDLDREYDSSYSNYGYLDVELDEATTTDLIKNSNTAFHTETNDLLLSALARTVHETYGCKNCVINLEGHGRHEEFLDNPGITESIGWYTCSYPFLLHVGSEELNTLIKTTKENLRGVRGIDVSYGMLRYLEKDSYTQINFEPQIGFNYLGQIDHEVENDLFSLSNYSFGSPVDSESTRPYVIDFSLKVISGRLQIRLNYNKSIVDNSEAEKLLKQYCDSLRNIIAYCILKEEPELTASDFGDATLSEEEIDRIMDVTQGKAMKVFQLSPTQEGMMFHNMLEHDAYTYFQQVSFNLCGDVNPEFIKNALEATFMKHESLRTKIICSGMRRARQVVVPTQCVDYEEVEMEQIRPEQQDAWLEEFLLKDRNKGFVIDGGNLTRITLVKFANKDYRIVWSFHHILMDGWCIGLLVNDFLSLYKDISNGHEVYVNTNAQYSDYIKWIANLETDKMEEFWKNYLYGLKDQHGMIPTTESALYSLDVKTLNYDDAITSQMKELAKQNNVTLNTLFEVLWAITLGISHDKEDIVFGTVYSGRGMDLEGIENVVGLHINTVPVRISFEPGERVAEVLKKTQAASFELEENQFLALTDIARAASLESPLYDHIIAFENYPLEGIGEKDSNDGSIWIGDKLSLFEQTNYNFNITVIPENELVIKFKYNKNAFNDDYIERIVDIFNKVLRHVMQNVGTKIKDIKGLVMSPSETAVRHISDYEFDQKILNSIYKYLLSAMQQEPKEDALERHAFSIIDKEGNRVEDGIVGNLCFAIDSDKASLPAYDIVYDDMQNAWFNTGVKVRVVNSNRLQYISMDKTHVLIEDTIYNLSQIEHTVSKIDCVQDHKAVVLRKKNSAYVVVYIVLSKPALPKVFADCAVNCNHVYYVRVEEIPEDTLGLSKLVIVKDKATGYIAPKTELQKKLASLWQEVLGVEKTSITDNFFELNGDSIKALRLVSRLYDNNLTLDMKDLFIYPTIAEIEKRVQVIESTQEETEVNENTLDDSDIDAIKALMEF